MEMKKEIQKVSVFLFIPRLIKILQGTVLSERARSSRNSIKSMDEVETFIEKNQHETT